MSNPQWKRCEREVARLLGGERVPVSGRARGDAPDIEHATLSVEVKHRRQLPQWLDDALDQAARSAQDGQTPVAILHQHRMKYADAIVCLRLRDLVAILDARGSPESH